MESCEMLKAKGNEYIGKLYNTYKWRNVLSRFQIYPATFFLHTIDWLTWTKTQHLLKGNGVSWKGSPGSLKGAKHWKFTLLVFFFFNNIFIITTLHLLPLLQISCWKKQRHTKDPGESWDSALIGKPFNIWKYNLTFLSIEEPSLLGAGWWGDTCSVLTKTYQLMQTNGCFPLCLYCSFLSPHLLGPHTPAQSCHYKLTCVQNTAPRESPKVWITTTTTTTRAAHLISCQKTLRQLLGTVHHCHHEPCQAPAAVSVCWCPAMTLAQQASVGWRTQWGHLTWARRGNGS